MLINKLHVVHRFVIVRTDYGMFRFLKNRCIPFSVFKTRLRDIRVGLDGSSSIMNLRKTRAIVVFNSFIAKCCPMQFRGPAENGMKAWESICFIFSGRNRSGSYAEGSFQTAGLRCMQKSDISIWVPDGMTCDV